MSNASSRGDYYHKITHYHCISQSNKRDQASGKFDARDVRQNIAEIHSRDGILEVSMAAALAKG